MQFVPKEHQVLIRNHLFKNKRAAVWAKMGRGKTPAVLDSLNAFNFTEEIYPVLVVATWYVTQNVWAQEIEKWADFRHLKCSIILGNPEERIYALKKNAHVYCINFENIPWLVKYFDGKWPFKTIVVDESSKLRGFRLRQGTVRSQVLSKVAFLSSRFIELTGTPSPKGLEHLWGQLYFIDKGDRLGRTFTAFKTRWFTEGFDGFSIKPLPHAQKEIMDLIKDVCLSIDDKYFPVDEPIFSQVPVTLPAKALKIYKDMEKDFFAEIGNKKVEAFNAAAKSQKLIQMANGAVYTDDKGSWSEIHNEKIEALKSVIEEANGAPVITAYYFKSDLSRLTRAFPRAKVLDKNPKTIKDWNAGKIQHLLLHPASAGHGLNLQHGGNILVFFSLLWDLELYLQVIERIGPARQKQSGYDRPVFIYLIMARNTLDYVVKERLDTKRSVQEILMEAMAKR